MPAIELAFPDLSKLVSIAVGFHATIYWIGLKGPRGRSSRYQVMPEEIPPHYDEFWGWHFDNCKQFHKTPEAAALAFVESFREWVAKQTKSA
jgi:hypothetical protein